MLRSLLVFSVLIPGFLMALRDRFMALLLYFWFGLFRPQDWIWFDITSLRLSLVLGVVLVVPALATGVWPNLTHPISLGMGLFLALGLIAQTGAVDQAVGWYWLDFFARLTVVSLLAISLTNTPRRLVRVLAVVAGSLGFYASKAGVLSLVSGGARYMEGLSGAFPDNNGYALATVMIMPLLLAVGQNAHLMFDGSWAWLNPWMRRAFLLAVPFCALTVVSTFSRGGFLAMVAATATYVVLHRQRLSLSLGLAAMVVVGLSVVPLPAGYIDRLNTITTYEEIEEESAISRTYFWRVAVDMAEANLFGVGMRNYEAAYDDYDRTYGQYGSQRAVHSSHFQVLAELGFVGGLVWAGLFAVAIRACLRARRRASHAGLPDEDRRFLETIPQCLIASMAGFLVGGSFLSAALNDLTWITFAMVASLDRISATLAAPAPDAARAPAPTYLQRLPTPVTRRAGGRV